MGDDAVTRGILGAVTREARSGAWFGSLDARRLEASVAATWRRPRCVLHVVLLDDGTHRERVVVKVRLDGDPTTGAGPATGRPLLAAAPPAPARDMARYELEGLTLIARAATPGDGRFAAVRPLALLPEHAAIVMDHVDAPTMRSVLMSASRPDPRRRSAQPVLERGFANAGALLRGYHSQVPDVLPPSRQAGRDELLTLTQRYVRHLADRTGDPAFFGRLEREAPDFVAARLPELLPLAVGHGDLVVRNLFVRDEGTVRLIDPMPRWMVPPYEDLARFVVGLRLLGLQVLSGGAAFSPRFLARLEASFLGGYFGEDAVPTEAVRAYQLVVLLDKWSATAGRTAGRGRRAALSAPVRWSSHRYFRGQAERLLHGPGARSGPGAVA